MIQKQFQLLQQTDLSIQERLEIIAEEKELQTQKDDKIRSDLVHKLTHKMNKNAYELEKKLLTHQKKSENKLVHSQAELEKKMLLTMDDKIKKNGKKAEK